MRNWRQEEAKEDKELRRRGLRGGDKDSQEEGKESKREIRRQR